MILASPGNALLMTDPKVSNNALAVIRTELAFQRNRIAVDPY
jgi:hypothetical protein